MTIEELKNNIKEQIKENGNQEITGQILQNVLVNMIDAASQKFEQPIFVIVSELPTEDIKLNVVYLVVTSNSKDSTNVFTEYVYANGQWEKLGEFKPEVDITGKADKNETIVEIKRLTGKTGREWNAYTDTEEYSDFKQYLISKGNYCGFYVNILSRPFTAEGFYSNYKPLISFGNGIKLAAYRIHTLHIGIFRDEATTHVPLYEFEIQDNKQSIIIIAPIELINSSYNEYDGIGIYAYAADEYNIVRPSLVNVGKQISLDLFKSVLAKDPNYTNEIGFISYTNSNNYRVKYADGRYALINTDKNVVIGGKDYNANNSYHAEGFGENGTTFTRGGTLEVNGSATVRDLTTRSITANGSVTINKELNVKESIRTKKTLEAGETTINGTLHCETHDIKTKSIYPAGTGSSSLKDPSLGAVKGNYIVNKGNLGKPAHNYDKLFVENIFWSDRTDFLNPETSLNTGYWDSVYRIFAKKGYKGKPTFYTNYTMYDELDDGYQIGIFSDMEDGIGGNENITMFFDNPDDYPEAKFCFNLSRGYIKHTIYGRNEDYVFGNGVKYDANTKIPADFVNLSEYVKSNEIYQCIKKEYDSSKRGENAIAIDDSAIASGERATAIGNNAQATGDSATALGNNAKATSVHSIALGNNAQATDIGAIALGLSSKATNSDSIALGLSAKAIGTGAIALGLSSEAVSSSTALGYFAKANDSSTALGYRVNAIGIGATALGSFAQATGTASIALGFSAITSIVSKYALGGLDENKEEEFNLEEITYSQYGNKKYLIGLGGYDGKNITINNEAGEKVLNPNIKSVQEIINGKADITPIVTSTDSTISLQPNKKYEITAGDTLTLTLTEPTDNTIVNEYKCAINTGSSALNVTLPQNVIWATEPTIEANKHYEISIIYSHKKYWGTIQAWNLPI